MVCVDIRHVGPAVKFEEPDPSLGDIGQVGNLHSIQHGGEARGGFPKAAGSRGDWEVREGRARGTQAACWGASLRRDTLALLQDRTWTRERRRLGA